LPRDPEVCVASSERNTRRKEEESIAIYTQKITTNLSPFSL